MMRQILSSILLLVVLHETLTMDEISLRSVPAINAPSLNAEENDLFADDFEELAESDLEKRRVGAARLNSQLAVPAGSSESRGQQKSKNSLRGHFGKRNPSNSAELDGEFDEEYENVKRAGSLRGKYGKRFGSLRGKYGKRAGSLRGKYGKRAGSLRGKYGKRAGSLRGKYGKRAGSLRGKYGR